MVSEKLVRRRVCVSLTKPYLDAVERLIKEGVYAGRGDLIRDALRRLFRHYEIRVFLDSSPARSPP